MRAFRQLVALSAALAASSPTLAAAQIPIRLGQSLTGRLMQTDQRFADSSRYKMYGFAGNKGDTVAVDLTSDDFDANLVLADALGNSLARNDDGGDRCNARLTFVLPQAGNYRIYANSSARAELGDFRLALARGRAAAPADTICRGFGAVAGLIQVGQTVTGTLTATDPEFSGDSTYFQRWILPVKPSQPFTVDLESSDFDAYLILTRGRGEKVVENDDGGGGCNARLVYSAQDDHPMRVVVNTASRPRHQTGRFTLRVSDGESQPEAKGNCRFTSAAATSTASSGTSQLSSGTSQATRSTQGQASTIRVGETVNGSLTSSDSLYPDNSYFKMYQFTPAAGQNVTIDLASDEFDPVLIIRGDDLDASVINDDGGPGCSARVSRAFPSRGPYKILVNTTASPERQTGRFTLSITDGNKPVQERGNADCQPPQRAAGGAESGLPSGGGGGNTASHSIAIGQTQQGSLTRSDVLLSSDSTYAQAWNIQGRAGTTVTIDLESDAFDSYLFLRGPGVSGGRDFQDDDGGGNCHARLTATFPQNGDYEIVVNTADKYATGAFTLSVTSGSKPKSVTRCSRSQ